MDDLQYLRLMVLGISLISTVLNLVINGWPSIHEKDNEIGDD